MLNKETAFNFFKGKTKPLSFKDIIHLMGLSRPESRSLKRVLRELVREGRDCTYQKGFVWACRGDGPFNRIFPGTQGRIWFCDFRETGRERSVHTTERCFRGDERGPGDRQGRGLEKAGREES